MLEVIHIDQPESTTPMTQEFCISCVQASRAAAADGAALPPANADAPSRRSGSTPTKLLAAQREVARLQAELLAVQEVDDAELGRLLQIIRESTLLQS